MSIELFTIFLALIVVIFIFYFIFFRYPEYKESLNEAKDQHQIDLLKAHFAATIMRLVGLISLLIVFIFFCFK